MQNKVYLNDLFDFYGDLLTDKQKEICTYYLYEDLSLKEISEITNTSRAAVHDILKRSSNELSRYEDTLHFLENFKTRMKIYEKMKKTSSMTQMQKYVNQCIQTERES